VIGSYHFGEFMGYGHGEDIFSVSKLQSDLGFLFKKYWFRVICSNPGDQFEVTDLSACGSPESQLQLAVKLLCM
jgi:hypothetical protein